jgi:hypothetical protein
MFLTLEGQKEIGVDMQKSNLIRLETMIFLSLTFILEAY